MREFIDKLEYVGWVQKELQPRTEADVVIERAKQRIEEVAAIRKRKATENG